MHGDSSLQSNPSPTEVHPPRRVARRPGRPAVYVFDKPDHQLTEEERKQKRAIEKRRHRQNNRYHRIRNKKLALGNAAAEAAQTEQAGPSQNARLQQTSPVAVFPQQPWPQPPPLIPGFAQNPLELLASATAGGSSVTTASSLPSSSDRVANTETARLPVSASNPTESSDHVSMLDSFQSSVSMPSSAMLIPGVDEPDTLEIDATAATSMDISMSFADSVPKEEGEQDNATEVLINSALVAAKEYAKNPLNLKDVMERERELRRMTGIKTIIFDNLRSKYTGFGNTVQSALRHFIIFPRTFNLRAAASVAGLEESQLVLMQGMLEKMIQSNFINTSKGRYELNEAARLFLSEDEAVLNDNIAGGTYDIAQNRFVQHYQTQLRRLQDDNIHKVGWLREQAMALFDSERENMEFSEYLLTGRNTELREFLSAGITVMRYCVSASRREKVLQKALMDDETSTEDIMLSLGMDTSTAETARSNAAKEDNEKAHRARLHLALSEAYFDQLKTEEAERPLVEALQLLGSLSPKTAGQPKANVIDSVLVLLLLSNLRLSAGKIKEARNLCGKALRILKEAYLGRSTFGINAMSNLVTIYLYDGLLDKAKTVATRLLDILHTMRYTGMPIYADALGVCAMVSMAENNFVQAEQQYGTALEIVGKWGNKQWTGIPMQHCMDLDLWLLEGLADAIRKQGRIEEAQELERRAASDRESRGLLTPPKSVDYLNMDQEDQQQDSHLKSRSSLRHLY